MYKYISIISGFSRGSNLDFIRSFCIVFTNIITSGIFYRIEKCKSWIGICKSWSIWSYFLLYGRSDTIWTGNAFKLLCVLEREISYKQETERSKNSSKLLSEGIHSLLGRFTDLMFWREVNQNNVTRCGFFNLSNGIFLGIL